MKNLMYSAILALGITTVGLPTVAQAQEVNYDPSASRIVETEIDRSDTAHVITLYTGARPLSYVMLTPPEDFDLTEDIEVMAEPGRIARAVAVDVNRTQMAMRPDETYIADAIIAEYKVNEEDEEYDAEAMNDEEDRRIVLLFDEPIPAKTNVKITLEDVEPLYPGAGSFFNYEVSGKHVGIENPIPYGIARFQADRNVRAYQ